MNFGVWNGFKFIVEPRICHFVARLMATSCSVSVLMKWGCWGHWGHWGHWGCWGHWGVWRSWLQGNHPVIKVQAAFDILRPKRLLRSLRPVMLSCLLRSLGPLRFSKPLKVFEINLVMARITLFWKKNLDRMMEFQVKFCHHSELRLWRTGMLFSTKSKGHRSNFRISWTYRSCFYDLKVHFWWPNKCSKHRVLRLNTQY